MSRANVTCDHGRARSRQAVSCGVASSHQTACVRPRRRASWHHDEGSLGVLSPRATRLWAGPSEHQYARRPRDLHHHRRADREVGGDHRVAGAQTARPDAHAARGSERPAPARYRPPPRSLARDRDDERALDRCDHCDRGSGNAELETRGASVAAGHALLRGCEEVQRTRTLFFDPPALALERNRRESRHPGSFEDFGARSRP